MLSQTDRLYNLLSDGLPHNTIEICEKVYGGSQLRLARVGARVNDLVKRGVIFCNRWGYAFKDTDKRRGWEEVGKYWYMIKIAPDAQNAPISDLKEENVIMPVQDTLFPISEDRSIKFYD